MDEDDDVISARGVPAYGGDSALSPTVEGLRDEVAANPHHPPPSLILFAVAAGAELRTALGEERLAEAYLTRIEAYLLAVPWHLPEVVAATYLDHATAVAERYPLFSQRAAYLRRHLPGSVLRLTLRRP